VSPSLRHAPLFHPRILRQLDAHPFPSDLTRRHDLLRRWVDSLRAGKLDEAKEVSVHGEFLTRIFGDALGYRSLAEAGAGGWELAAEKTVGLGGKSADGALGFFQQGKPGRVLAAIELKGAKQSLDHAAGRALTPVQQAWDYANHSPGCRWILVSNYRETRLYSTARTPDVYEIFLLEELEDLAAFKRFYFLLARETLLPRAPDETSPVDQLLAASAKVEAEITKELYEEYRTLRKQLYVHLGRAHSNLPAAEVLGHAQTILDRVLFIAFAEDRGLLPLNTLADACAHRDRYDPQPIWKNFRAIFRWIDEGNPKTDFPAYNGGLFRRDTMLDHLEVSDEMCEEFKRLARYDFREEVSVDVLGHIFEQSITDLEELRAEAVNGGGEAAPTAKVSKRRVEGIFYTPAYITRFIVDRTLGRVFDDRWQAILAAREPDKRKAKEQKQAWIETWEAYREELKTIRVLDPACGSGAFLVAAFDALGREYERVNAALAELREGQIGLFDLTRTVLNNNLFGVDLNSESVEITRLSLWLKTAERGKRLTYLDSNIKWGDSIVKDPDISRVAFDWARGSMARSFLDVPTAAEAAEIDARWRGGFDVVIGNPPYIRQELLTHLKEHLGSSYAIYHGMADIFVYFFERGISLLKPGGRLGFIVANKWLRSGYAEPLRRLLAQETRLETLVDFGHAPIFPDADTFPCVVTLMKPQGEPAVPPEHALSVTSFPRELLQEISIPEYVASHRYDVPQRRLGADSWSLEPPAAEALFVKIRGAGIALSEFTKVKPYYGLKTGCNEAFLINTATRDLLIREDHRCTDVIKKYLRGQDIARWSPEWSDLWIILLKSSGDQAWPWKDLPEQEAEATFASTFPSFYNRFKSLEELLRKRTDKGRYWWELRSCAYYQMFSDEKLIYQEIQFHPAYASDTSGMLLNNKGFFLPTADAWLLSVLNSPLMWWYNWRYLPHMKDETLSPVGVRMETLPIARPSDAGRAEAERMALRLVGATKENNSARAGVLDSLRMQFDIETPGQKLEDFARLTSDAFVAEVLKRRPRSAGKLKAAAMKDLRAMYDDEAIPMQARQREARELERSLSALVNDAYGLTPEEVALMWSTAPPRMPALR
jgi:type I restriction-modification system DNA methylase subunit